MAIIKKLSLTYGGGIISSATQCEQVENTVSLFIGLGGTGINAIRSIKKQVNECIIPDNAEEYDNPNNNVSVREYRRIRFLAIDTDLRSYRDSLLDGFDCIDLSLSGNHGPVHTDNRPDLKWINDTGGTISRAVSTGYYTGGNRQAGRYLLFNKFDELESKIQHIVDDAKLGIPVDCKVLVNVFSGLGGGTGSGIFLDVCYAVRRALGSISNRYTCGYFFMPEVNLSWPHIDDATKQYISRNGYAALQELNYCMNIPENGGAFRQIIKDGSYIDWRCPPVDMCYLIGAPIDKNEAVSVDTYEKTMQTVTECNMAFLSDNDSYGLDAYGLASNWWYIRSAASGRTGGYNPCMVSLGAACASISYREINTYLACGMFEEYRKVHNETVQQIDAEDAINKAWNVTSLPLTTMVEKIYASLLQKLTGNDTTGLQGYDYYQDPDGLGKPWKFLLETVQSNGDNNLEAVYQTALQDHIGNLAANADKLISTGVDGVDNKESLIYLLDQALDPIVKDINRGPKFAKNIIDHVEGANVLNLIQGLKAKNNAEYQAKEKDRTLRYEDYLETKRIFFNQERQGMFDSDKRRYEDFENCVIAYVQLIEQVGGVYSSNPNARPLVGVYAHITNILDTLEKQIRDRVANYYAPLCDTLADLTDTFEANYSELINKSTSGQKLGFNNPLIAINDPNIIDLLDAQIKGISMPNTFRLFMESMIAAGYDVWQKKETRLPKTVQSFFVGRPGGIFTGFAGTTVDMFLETKYDLTGEELEQQIINDYVGDLKSASTPSITLDRTKQNGESSYIREILFPSISSVCSHALESTTSIVDKEWTLVPSSLSDRLVFIQISRGFPLQAYAGMKSLENECYSYSLEHLYEANKPCEDNLFSDWRELPTITVPSFMDDDISEAIKAKVDSARVLFDRAVEYGVVKINSPYNELNENSYSYLFGVPEALQAEIDGLADVVASAKPSELESLKVRVSELLAGGYKELERTDLRLKQPGGRCDEDYYDERLKFDFFYLSPVYQIKVRAIIDKLEENYKTLQRISDILGGKS